MNIQDFHEEVLPCQNDQQAKAEQQESVAPYVEVDIGEEKAVVDEGVVVTLYRNYYQLMVPEYHHQQHYFC